MHHCGETIQRGPSGPRLPVRACLALGLCLPLMSCGHFGPGLAELPSEQGWHVMPVAKWIIENALRPETVVFCPAERCIAPAMVAVFRVHGQEATRLERDIADNPAKLLRQPVEKPTRPLRRTEKDSKPAHPGSDTTIEKIDLEGLKGARIILSSRAPDMRLASGVVLARRSGTGLALAVAVTTDPDLALRHARAAIRSASPGPFSGAVDPP